MLVTPLISVVIPVYNRTWELQRALQSLSVQTVRNFEVIVCDDGSTEDVRSVVDSFTASLRITYRRIDNSGGPARPRNVGIGLAQGEWISFLDSDDWWDSDRMAVVGASLNDDIDLLYHPLRFVGASGRPVRRGLRRVVGSPLRCHPLRHMMFFGNPVPNSAAVVRRSLLNRIGGICEDRSIVAYEDFDAWMRLVEIGARMHFLNRPLGSYWIGEDGISGISERQIERQVALFGRHVSNFSPDFRTAAEACHNYIVGSMWSRIGNHSHLARDYLWRAKGLPTITLRLKRLLRLAMTFPARTQKPA
jgi:glycosyltransferase involved in cell wall biosynthesis